MTLPVALSGSDVIGQAKTGTGKTLGFGLPLLERVTVPADVESGRADADRLTDAPQALVVVPTRELCQQVTNDLLTAGKARNVRVLAIYGGRAYEPQVEALQKGVDVVVGTPGRLLDLARQKKLTLSAVRALVLDEADEMLDLGFLPDVERIIEFLPAKRQTMLFSATMPGQVVSLARRYMTQPTHISATSPDDAGQTVANITQHIFRAHSMDKPEMVSRILQARGRGLAMIFCRTKRTAADIADQLSKRGFAAGAVHGDLGQGAREQALRAFRNGKVDVLVCTDVAARGIDVEGVTHVINYQTPEDEKTYLHRVGRTGRAGNKGTAVTLVDWDDIPRWQLINKALDLPFQDPEETYSTSGHLYELLDIPEGTKGVLPRNERTRAGLAAEEVEDLGETGGRGRSGGRRGEGRDSHETREAPAERTRTPRRRRRTRNGAPVGEGGRPAEAAKDRSGAEASLDAAEGAAPSDGPRQPRRRRRTRRSGESQPAAAQVPARDGEQTASAPEASPAVAPVAEAVVETVGETPEAPAGPRRRTRRAAEPAVTAEVVTEPAPAAATEAVETVTKPRRTRKTAAAKAAPTEAATEAADTAAEAAAPKETPAPRRRTRKTAATTPAPATDTATATADEAPAKPRRTRKATAKPAEAPATAETAATEAVETVTKPRRTRKSAAAKTAPTEAADTAAEAAAPKETPAPRRRTRKTATTTPAPATDTADEAPAKPRRTRKATAKPAEAPATAETAEVPAQPRRARKRTAKAAEAAPES
ncbi:DEAD/DEAH box helicase [Streptomyces sp. NPDC059740]|uniref:DEAD/DEAH box helicase n=1 Tax=Streptomyces sp. NPDC059740 TaxID=3346926 RepID=UPI00364CE6D3